MLKVGDKAPDFTLVDDSGGSFKLSDQSGNKVLLVFYPGDNTPVCTKQLCDYRDGLESFEGLGVKVVGISHDGAESHQEFREKHDLPFTLLTDPEYQVASLYDSKSLLGMKRSIFLVDESRVIRYLHIESLALFRRRREEVLEAIEKIN
jgi:peroxiredoxin Q/BCP